MFALLGPEEMPGSSPGMTRKGEYCFPLVMAVLDTAIAIDDVAATG